MKLYEKNLDLFAREHPVDAIKISQIGKSPYKPLGEDNLKMPWGPLYETDPEKEAAEWFKSLSLSDTQVLYVYGVGLGAYYRPLKKWLSQDSSRHAVFFDDDLAMVKEFLKRPCAEDILNDPQVSICYLNDPSDVDGVLETLYWSFVLTRFKVTALKSYHLHKEKAFHAFSTKISYSTTMKNALVEEYLHYGVAFFKNFYPNILHLHDSKWGNSLFGKFKGVPAIICGAGPSLEKQIELLGTLKDKALIFAGGSSLNGISAKGVLPHFGAGIDPNPTQLIRLSTNQAKEIPFFYRTRMLHEAFLKIPGEKLYISGAGGYDVAEWYEEKFGLKSEFLDEGHNVVNFCTEIAERMGCNPILYVGMDLAFTGMKAYSGGIEEDVSVSKEKLLEAEDEEYKGIERLDIHGKPIYTLWKWIGESEWLSAFAKQHPETVLVNCTEGGIGFPDVPNMEFKKAVSRYLKKPEHLAEKVKKAVAEASLDISKKAVVAATLELKESLKRAIDHIHILFKELDKEKEKNETTGALTSGLAALAETELFEEMGYKFILDVFHQVFVRVQNRKIVQMRLNKNERFDAHSIALQKIELQRERLDFLRNVAAANMALIDYALN